MPLNIKFTKTPLKYVQLLDRPTKERIIEKLKEIAKDHLDTRHSKPLKNSTQRSARVGGYRILLEVEGADLIVSEVGPRGQIYRKI